MANECDKETAPAEKFVYTILKLAKILTGTTLCRAGEIVEDIRHVSYITVLCSYRE
ncbi:hypothetical protein T12_5022 [Trichinella patagoniensis]|nr:hypothetical protein T12_5022 [Trichinella patagoniensis]